MNEQPFLSEKAKSNKSFAGCEEKNKDFKGQRLHKTGSGSHHLQTLIKMLKKKEKKAPLIHH